MPVLEKFLTTNSSNPIAVSQQFSFSNDNIRYRKVIIALSRPCRMLLDDSSGKFQFACTGR